jgi:hypothetical protein
LFADERSSAHVEQHPDLVVLIRGLPVREGAPGLPVLRRDAGPVPVRPSPSSSSAEN